MTTASSVTSARPELSSTSTLVRRCLESCRRCGSEGARRDGSVRGDALETAGGETTTRANDLDEALPQAKGREHGAVADRGQAVR